jgi:glutamate/tyrosine decarboxylase-like PLP-dependent enzyme
MTEITLADIDRDEAVTEAVATQIQKSGTAWLGATTWHGERLLRVSVSNWSTTAADVDATVEAIVHARDAVLATPA